MQKALLMVALLGTTYAQELTPTQASKLKNYSHSLSGKIRHKRLLRRTAVITKKHAHEMAKDECDSEAYASKLSVRSNRLFYTLYTDEGRVKIDALDGEIMQKCTQ